jgi:hypothetical protein
MISLPFASVKNVASVLRFVVYLVIISFPILSLDIYQKVNKHEVKYKNIYKNSLFVNWPHHPLKLNFFPALVNSYDLTHPLSEDLMNFCHLLTFIHKVAKDLGSYFNWLVRKGAIWSEDVSSYEN